MYFLYIFFIKNHIYLNKKIIPVINDARIITGAKIQIINAIIPKINISTKDIKPTAIRIVLIKNPITRITVLIIKEEKKPSIPPAFSSLILFHGENKVRAIVGNEK